MNYTGEHPAREPSPLPWLPTAFCPYPVLLHEALKFLWIHMDILLLERFDYAVVPEFTVTFMQAFDLLRDSFIDGVVLS